MSRQLAIGIIVGFAAAVLVLSLSEGRTSAPVAPLQAIDAGVIIEKHMDLSRTRRRLEDGDPKIYEGRTLGRPALILQLLADGGT